MKNRGTTANGTSKKIGLELSFNIGGASNGVGKVPRRVPVGVTVGFWV